MEDVILYSTNCVNCKVLKTKLEAKGIQYSVVSDIDEMLKLGMTSAPNLKVGDILMNYGEAVKWVKSV